MKFPRKLLNEMGGQGHRGPRLPKCDVPTRPLGELLPGARLRASLQLPRVSEPEVVRHFVELSTLNHHIDRGMYPLVPFILVLLVVGVQLIPLAIGSSLFTAVADICAAGASLTFALPGSMRQNVTASISSPSASNL